MFRLKKSRHSAVPQTRWRFLVSGLLAVLILLSFGLLKLLADKPPVVQYQDARQALQHARDNNAAVYAPERFVLAETQWVTAMAHLKAENQRLFFYGTTVKPAEP